MLQYKGEASLASGENASLCTGQRSCGYSNRLKLVEVGDQSAARSSPLFVPNLCSNWREGEGRPHRVGASRPRFTPCDFRL